MQAPLLALALPYTLTLTHNNRFMVHRYLLTPLGTARDLPPNLVPPPPFHLIDVTKHLSKEEYREYFGIARQPLSRRTKSKRRKERVINADSSARASTRFIPQLFKCIKTVRFDLHFLAWIVDQNDRGSLIA